MRVILALTAAAAVLLAGMPANASVFGLTQDKGVQGTVRICEYANGKDYTVNATSMCPMTVTDDLSSMAQDSGNVPPPTITGTYVGSYMDGMTKICVYEVMGTKRAIRVDAPDMCPMSQAFQQ